jgi:hypothetical protein
VRVTPGGARENDAAARGPARRWTSARVRGCFNRHNREVFLLVVLTLLGTAALWGLIYVGIYWLTLVFLAATRGLDAQPPESLPALFIYTAALLVAVAWLWRAITPDRGVPDKKESWELALDLLLAVPRATLAVWGSLRAWQSLSAPELELAAELLERVEQERVIPVYRLPLEIPRRAMRERIVLGLQWVQLVDVRRYREELCVMPGNRFGPSPAPE